uniref:Chymotrypsin C n=1 Tax=Sus scrofa TaxID=9823 RepID=A0A8D1U2Q1_PIG
MLGITVLAALLAYATPGLTAWPWGRTTWRWKTRKAPWSWVWIASLSMRSGTPCFAMTLPLSSWLSPWN